MKIVLRKVLGLCRAVVLCGWEIDDGVEGSRPKLVVRVRLRAGGRLRCGRCGQVAPGFDQGGGQRRWRHLDVGFATTKLVADAPRVSCPTHGPTVVEVPWARHDSAFSRAFEDLVVWQAVTANKTAAVDRYGISWRAVNNACVRVATEALARVDLLEGLVAVAIDEVKYKKGHRYLTVVCDHLSGRVVWAAKGRSKETVASFFDALGDQRASRLAFVTCDGAEWIRSVVAERAPGATVCLDTFHVISWAGDALDEVRRGEWNALRNAGDGNAAKEFKGLRFLLLRNWENLTGAQTLLHTGRFGRIGPVHRAPTARWRSRRHSHLGAASTARKGSSSKRPTSARMRREVALGGIAGRAGPAKSEAVLGIAS